MRVESKAVPIRFWYCSCRRRRRRRRRCHSCRRSCSESQLHVFNTHLRPLDVAAGRPGDVVAAVDAACKASDVAADGGVVHLP